jgi:P-type Cu2+ transporter
MRSTTSQAGHHHHEWAPERPRESHADKPSQTVHAHSAPKSPGAHEHGGVHDRHAGRTVAMFRDKFWLTLLLTIPTLAWTEMVQPWFGFTAAVFPGSTYIPAIFGTAVCLYGGWVFLAGAVRELQDRLPGMMTLISLAISVAVVFGLAMTLGYAGEALWWELATLVTIMLLGHWIEMRSVFQASGALRIIALSRASDRKTIQNLWWAAGYNLIAIPPAAGVLVGRGIVLPPAFAAVLMSASTVIVAINAQLLRRAKL